MQEQFKIIKDYEGRYEISNFGRVKSLAKSWITGKNAVVRKKPDTILKAGIDNNGYEIINLYNNNGKTFYIHRLVWDYFGDSPRNGRELQIDHVDNNKRNNYIENLQLLTHRENSSKGKLLVKKSGLPTGVFWNKRAKKYVALVTINNKSIHLGCFNNISEASNTYQVRLKNLK